MRAEVAPRRHVDVGGRDDLTRAGAECAQERHAIFVGVAAGHERDVNRAKTGEMGEHVAGVATHPERGVHCDLEPVAVAVDARGPDHADGDGCACLGSEHRARVLVAPAVGA